MLRIKRNQSIMKSLGLEEKAKSSKSRAQKRSRNHCKEKLKNVVDEDELYMPDKSAEVESELDSSDELSSGNYLSNARSESSHMKVLGSNFSVFNELLVFDQILMCYFYS